MIKDQNVLDAGLEDILLYLNIRKSGIIKVSTRPQLFPCAEVIRWILPQADTSIMIMSNTEGQYFASFTPAYITKVCNLPTPKISMKDDWINSLSLYFFDCVKWIMIIGNQFRQKSFGNFETTNLCTPYRPIALMLNKIFGREN